MADTALNSFSNAVAGYLSTIIFQRIVDGLAGKGITTSVDELLDMTKIPLSVRGMAPAPTFGGTVSQQSSSGKKAALASTISDTRISGRCEYQFKRGENKSKFCGKPVSLGNIYCNACSKQRGKNSNEGATPGVAPGNGIPGFTAPTPADNQPGSLSVVPFDEARGLFRDPTHNFIVHQINAGTIAVIGKKSESDNTIVPLTSQEKAVAKDIGLFVPDNQTSIPGLAPLLASSK